MELQQLKQEWGLLTNKIDQIESLNREILEKMIAKKAQTAQDKVMKYERFFMLTCYGFALVYGVLFALYHPVIIEKGLLGAFCLFEVVMIVFGSWQGYKMWLLEKMNVAECSPAELVERSIKFKVITKMRFIVGIALIFPVMGLAYYLMRDYLVGNMTTIMIVAAVVGAGVGILAEMKHFRSINKLIASLKEIKECRKG